MWGISRGIIETLDETSTLDDVVEACDALNLLMDCQEDVDRDRTHC